MKDIVWMAWVSVVLTLASVATVVWSPRVEIAYIVGIAAVVAAILSLRE